jgi:5-(carboxyamino)imidazole ribonucleotide mutase
MKKVLFVVGSKNDIPLLLESKKLFKKEKIDFDIKVISCHRNIKSLVEELDLKKIEKENIGVILSIAHSVANLPAIIAGYLKESSIQVIGIGYPKTDLDKLASLLSVVSIPKGVPLLNAGIGDVGLYNATLCCVKILKSC